MAKLPYKEDQSIHSMNTRQLRQYIADQADEAQERLDSAPKDVSKAFDELKSEIIYQKGIRTGKVKRSTSNMSKAEMREYAYTLRQFNAFDTESKFAEKTDWQKNKKRYESFIKNQVAKSGAENQYWSKYITEKGNVSKRGYKEYKDFIATLKASEEYIKTFGYRTLQQYAQDSRNNVDPGNKILNKTLARVYTENKGKGLTQAQLLDELKTEYDKALAAETSKQKSKQISVKKPKKSSSKSTTVKVKKAGKMRTSGAVRNKLS